MVFPFLLIVVLVVLKLRAGVAPAYAVPLLAVPLLLGGGLLLKSWLSRPAVLTLDDRGMELDGGSATVRPQGWRLKWEEIESTAIVCGLYGDELIVMTHEARKTAPMRSELLGWTLDRSDALLVELGERGLAPQRDPESRGDGTQRFSLGGQTDLLAARATICWTLVAIVIIAGLEILAQRWDRLAGNIFIAICFGYPFALATRTMQSLDVSEDAVTLRQISPRGFLSSFRLHPPLKEETAWTLSWTSLRRVRLGRKEGGGPDLWLELEADHMSPRIKYRDADGAIERADALRRVFNAHGFPIELVLWPDPAESEAKIDSRESGRG